MSSVKTVECGRGAPFLVAIRSILIRVIDGGACWLILQTTAGAFSTRDDTQQGSRNGEETPAVSATASRAANMSRAAPQDNGKARAGEHSDLAGFRSNAATAIYYATNGWRADRPHPLRFSVLASGDVVVAQVLISPYA